jgi:hypothetical protein
VAPSPDALPPPVAAVRWGPAPPDQAPGVTVGAAQEQRFPFRTARAGLLPDPELLRFDAQGRFDARALARYLIGFAPAGGEPTHLLHDPLCVHLRVQWVEALLQRYGLAPALRVRRTDPPPQAAPAGASALSPPPFDFHPKLDLKPVKVRWEALPPYLRGEADRRVAAAAALAPCLPGAPVDGATAVVKAPLEPGAWYDLRLEAVPLADPDADGLLIGLSHFRTSRYADVPALLGALGLRAAPEAPWPFEPLDTPVAAPAPAAVALGDDRALDEALAQMGLDPWPLPRSPQLVLLWARQGAGWALAGALLDSDEALIRGPRMELPPDPAAPPPPRLELVRAVVGGVELRPRRSNAAATRVLLAPGAPAAPTGADPVFALEVRDRGQLRSARRACGLAPTFVTQERS